MAITYTWNVSTVDTYISHTDDNNVQEDDVIYNVHWRLTGDDTTNTASVIGTQSLDVSDLSSFTDFDSVTTSDVEGWVTTAMGSAQVQALKDNISAQLTELATPTKATRTIS
jgi:hypothetical protein